MAMEQRRAWSLNGAAVELGHDRRTIAKAAEGLEPVGRGRRGEALYRLADIARRLAGIENGRLRRQLERMREGERGSRRGRGGPEPTDFLIGGGGPLQTVTGEELMQLMGWSWDDVREALMWAMPVIVCGRPSSPRGWVFPMAFVIRWCGYVSQGLRIFEPSDLITTLRDLREEKGEPLATPTGFEPLTKERGIAAMEDTNGHHHHGPRSRRRARPARDGARPGARRARH